MKTPMERAAAALVSCQKLLVITGAGISAESGIPTFRGAGGLWRGFDATRLATPEAFAQDPQLVWDWYRWRRQICRRAVPNEGHQVIQRLEQAIPDFLLATQNVDGLHPHAGTRRLVELHGDIDQARCVDRGCAVVFALPDRPEQEGAPLPECPSCGGLARPHILWFGEQYWDGILERIYAFMPGTQVVLVVGTSARVWPPVALALAAQKLGAFMIDVNPEATDLSRQADVHLVGAGGSVLPELMRRAGLASR